MKNNHIPTKEEYLEAVSRYNLTVRERELAYLKINGFSNKRIADMYGISVATVKKHFTHIYEKMWVPGRAELLEIILQMKNGEKDDLRNSGYR